MTEATLLGASEEEIDRKLAEKFPDAPPEPGAEPEKTPEQEPPADQAEPEKEPAKEKDAEDEAETATLSLSELASVLGADENLFDVSEDGKVMLRTKVDGEEGKVSLGDALKSYQLQGHLNKQNMEVVNQRKAIEAERAAFSKERGEKLQQLEDVIQLGVAELQRDFKAVDWERLRVSDQNEYLIKRQEFQDRENTLKQSVSALQQARQEESQKFHAERIAKVQQELPVLRSRIPGWDTDEGYRAGTKIVRDTLVAHGFTEEEVEAASQGITMPPEVATRIIILAHKAAEYDKLQSHKPAVLKKVRDVPKVVKSGTPPESKTSLQKSLETVRKTEGEKGLDDYLAVKLGIK